MKNVTIKAMIKNSNIPASLIRSTIKQFGNFDYFKQSASDIARYGASGGYSGFVYYADTVPFTKRNKKAIIEFLKSEASEFGCTGIINMLKDFNCFKGMSEEEIADGLYNPKSDEQTTVFNGLAWYALEEVSRLYDDMKEQD